MDTLPNMISITPGAEREHLRSLLLLLNPDAQPLWGKMTPQQMVEHMADQITWTNGKQTCTCSRTPEEAEKVRQRMIYTDAELPKNIVSGTLPSEYVYPNIATAVDAIMNELADFDTHYQQSNVKEMHPGFGLMNHNEWIIWHNKHFTHHLKQFGVIE